MRRAEFVAASAHRRPPDAGARAPVLAVDLDGTLVRGDLLHEAVLRVVASQPAALLAMPGWLARGKAHFKQQIAARCDAVDVSTLPFQRPLVDWIASERAAGRRIVLCTAADRRLAQPVADYLPLFDDVMASDGTTNLSAHTKADALVERFGARGFDYAGNAHADVAVWARARRAIVVAATPRVRAAAGRVAVIDREFGRPDGTLHQWLLAMRLHQWVKNLLVFLPLLAAHRMLEVPLLVASIWAFIAFGLCASSVYLLNDLFDLASDRRHPRKRERPFASGRLAVPHGLAASAALAALAFALALTAVRWQFAAWLGVYFGLTLCYTFWLKRKVLVDSLVLAGLYTLRVLAGAAAVAIDPGFWLLAFSMFLFLSLAMVKRFSELRVVLAQGHGSAAGRGYLTDDLHLVQTLGLASGFSAVLVMALYINGDSISGLYPHHEAVWLTVPVLLYWVSRLWLKAHRDEMTDDPIVFALTDRVSRATIALFFAALLLASWP